MGRKFAMAALGMAAVGCGGRADLVAPGLTEDAGTADPIDAGPWGAVHAVSVPPVDAEYCFGEGIWVSNMGTSCTSYESGWHQEQCNGWWGVALHVPEIWLHPGTLEIQNDAKPWDCRPALWVFWLADVPEPRYPVDYPCSNPGGKAAGDAEILEVTSTEIVFSLENLAPWDELFPVVPPPGEDFPWARAAGIYTAERCDAQWDGGQ